MQEKVDNLTERLERESVVGERQGGTEEIDGGSTKGGIKTKCMYSTCASNGRHSFSGYFYVCYLGL